MVGREFVQDLAPEPQKGKVMPEGMINALLRIGPADTVCPLEVHPRACLVCVRMCVRVGAGAYMDSVGTGKVLP